MSRLDELIQEYCPDGVDYKPLKNLASIDIGKFVRSDKQGDEKPYPVFNGGRRNTGMYDEYNHDGDYILISARGANAGYTNYFSGKYWAGNSCYSVAINPSIINYRFAYYVIKNSEQAFLGKQQTGSIPAVSKVQVSNLLIPVPPFPVQEEIVRILDEFTLLSAELAAELAARKKQYEYYKDMLINNQNDRKQYKLEDIATYSTDRIEASNVDENTYVGVDNLLQDKKGKKLSESVPENGKIIGYKRKDILIGNIRPYLKKIWLADNDGGTNGDVLTIRVSNNNVIIAEYLYYVLSSDVFFNYDNSHSKGAKMPRGDKKAVMQYKFALPSIKEQERIVSILDRFDTLCNDISAGLPAEIEARQKQYEYYRDKLLTFKELK